MQLVLRNVKKCVILFLYVNNNICIHTRIQTNKHTYMHALPRPTPPASPTPSHPHLFPPCNEIENLKMSYIFYF